MTYGQYSPTDNRFATPPTILIELVYNTKGFAALLPCPTERSPWREYVKTGVALLGWEAVPIFCQRVSVRGDSFGGLNASY